MHRLRTAAIAHHLSITTCPFNMIFPRPLHCRLGDFHPLCLGLHGYFPLWIEPLGIIVLTLSIQAQLVPIRNCQSSFPPLDDTMTLSQSGSENQDDDDYLSAYLIHHPSLRSLPSSPRCLVHALAAADAPLLPLFHVCGVLLVPAARCKWRRCPRLH